MVASKALAALLADKAIAAAHIDAETPDKVRARHFAKLREGSLSVLCNVDVLSEGFDEPKVGCVLCAPLNSNPRPKGTASRKGHIALRVAAASCLTRAFTQGFKAAAC